MTRLVNFRLAEIALRHGLADSVGSCPQDGYQKRYFVLDSFEDGAAKLEAYCK